MPVLNEFLYGRLSELFGHVEVAKPLQAFRGRPGPIRNKYIIQQSGEYYRVNCPYCKDTRQRLWINHTWGVPDEWDNAHWWAAVCYNETSCLSREDLRKDLITCVYKDIGRAGRRSLHVATGYIEPPEPEETTLPGNCTRLDQLLPTHPANAYLRDDRGFDINYLVQKFDIHVHQGFCPDFKEVTDRIVIPIYFNGLLVGWQARYVGEYDWRIVRKYYIKPNMAKSRILYNYDRAKQCPFPVLVEGATDVWSVGDAGICILGSSLTEQQARLIVDTWPLVVVALDDQKAWDASLPQLLELQRVMPVIRVMLPQGTDPSKMIQADRDLFWNYVDGAARHQGIDLLEVGHGTFGNRMAAAV